MRPGEGEGSEEELRLSVGVLPLRLRIDQAVVDFCQVPQQPFHHMGASLWESLYQGLMQGRVLKSGLADVAMQCSDAVNLACFFSEVTGMMSIMTDVKVMGHAGVLRTPQAGRGRR